MLNRKDVIAMLKGEIENVKLERDELPQPLTKQDKDRYKNYLSGLNHAMKTIKLIPKLPK